LALILAGGAGSRLELLTDPRAKPSLPFAGTYRLIDIPLSNLMHSGLSEVWIVEQYRPHSLNDHLASGRPWDLDRTYGGLRVLPPYQGAAGEGFASGNADALYRSSR
jgi:glucose-1-phosphate adenylyltransferase